MNIPDNYSQWEAHERKQERELEKLPRCEDPKCKKRIQDEHCFVIDGEILCEDCMIRRYRVNTEDLIN